MAGFRGCLCRRKVQRRRFRRKRKTIAILKRGDVIQAFFAGIADLQEIRFQQGNAVGQKFRKRTVEVFAQGRVQRVLEYVRQLCRNFRKARESVARRSPAQCVRRNVQPLEIFAARRDLLQHADVLPQILQVLGGLLEKHLDGFAVRHAHARPSVTSSGFCSSSAVGLRYRMQSFSTMA